MKTSRVVRSGSLVGVGPAGQPPTIGGGLRTNETVDATPTSALARPAGSIVHQRAGALAWIAARIAGVTQWISLSILYTLANAYAEIVAIVGAYLAGWRPAVVVHDAAFNAASVTVSGLSAAKRYTVTVQAADNGVFEDIELRPDSSAAGCSGRLLYQSGATADGALSVNLPNGGPTRTIVFTVGPRINGASPVMASSGQHATCAFATAVLYLNGATTTDFTSLQIVVSATSRTGWLTVVEETP